LFKRSTWAEIATPSARWPVRWSVLGMAGTGFPRAGLTVLKMVLMAVMNWCLSQNNWQKFHDPNQKFALLEAEREIDFSPTLGYIPAFNLSPLVQAYFSPVEGFNLWPKKS
jgi:hypothetical protein